MIRTLAARVERFPVRGSFVIARGAKTHVDVAVAVVGDGRQEGRGEATAIYYRGETAETVVAAINARADAVAAGAGRADLLGLMPHGAARNALDAALWDLEAKASGQRVWQRLDLPQPRPLLTAFTISLGEPGAMAAAAASAGGRELLKIKLGGDGGPDADVERMAAVRAAAPDARLIVDANEAWGGTDIARTAAALAGLGVELIEQPVPAGQDALLDGVRSPVPLAADESCHDRASLDAIIGRYTYINIKLDKAGGLTEAHALAHAARQRGLGVMTGCMLSTSLGIAPAFYVAMQGQYADLDGPLLIEDRPAGLRFEDSDVWPPEPELWG
ncbi:N-acetyl-D-Glu racemase DgcA [Polymorphobacter fuscus]|uniref:Dipeptide epimerase n=1 Tax=Sandarakinorhabdus fusca TaxID=1439888 RepID=A0A7C9GVM4_9SPHN|nr:N-acetyl-D-Glu racemase DgcA [Polymorphobacter fuscus]KAB7646403.1 dipeptide epimerase [Polymorphobacter fuscus]MQT17638.1 dipeptide epimerase [Polymorphobacter fuscus]NJC09818.1 L-alanine-DL-glutamate epimerase-like enolase superfamily enzyme [Polymorphobacter fuscus]